MILDIILGTIYPKIRFVKLPCPVADLIMIPGYELDDLKDVQVTPTECNGRYRGSPITVYLDGDHIHGIRYDLQLRVGILRRVLRRSSQKYLGVHPEVLIDIDLTYVANIGDNVATISGYIGSIGLWTREYHAKIREKK